MHLSNLATILWFITSVAFLYCLYIMPSQHHITLVDPNTAGVDYLFPSSLIYASAHTINQQCYFASIGAIPYGAFCFNYSPPQLDTDPHIVNIPFLSVAFASLSGSVFECVLDFISSTLSIDIRLILFNLSVSETLDDSLDFGCLNYNLINRHSITEVAWTLKLTDHWRFLWKLFERNYQQLAHQYMFSITQSLPVLHLIRQSYCLHYFLIGPIHLIQVFFSG